MKPSRRLDRPVCGIVLSSGLRPSPRPVPRPLPAASTPRPAQCSHWKTQGEAQRIRPFGSWVSAVAGSDPASGTLLPLLCPPAWTGTLTKSYTTTARKTAAPRKPARCLYEQPKQTRSFTISNPTRGAASASQTKSKSSRKISFTGHPPQATGPWKPNRYVQTEEDLLAFVDPPADGETVDDHLEFMRDPYLRRYARPEDPQILLDNSSHDDQYPTWSDLQDQDEEVQHIVHRLNHIVWHRLRSPHKTSAAKVFEQYRLLPGSRMSVIPYTLRHRLLHALGMSEKKNAEAMLRYFAVVADVRDAGFPLKRIEWNTAMSYAGRYVGEQGGTEMEAALHLWREMERAIGTQANYQTFNILFDVAAKAGNFTLAEMLYLEMERRGFSYNRYHNVSLIYLFGLKLNSDGVRAAYREMVTAGEMIDSTVLNCLIVCFLRCGEEDAAERVYRTMFDKYRTRTKKRPTRVDHRRQQQQPTPPANAKDADVEETFDQIVPLNVETPNYASSAFMPDVLMMLANVSREIPSLRPEYQFLMPTRPNIDTFRNLISHYAIRMGDLDAVTRYLNDMKLLRIPLHGAVFLALFKGFGMHGGINGTGSQWTERRLRGIWAALLRALDDKVEGLYVNKWMLIWALRAFHRCSTPEMVFRAYQSLTTRWEMNEEEMDFSISFLHSLLKRGSYHYGDTTRQKSDVDPWNSHRNLSVLGTLDNYSFDPK